MAKGTKSLYNGPVKVDVSGYADKLVDLPENGKKGLKREKPGFDAMHKELHNARDSGALAKISVDADVVSRIDERTATLKGLRDIKGVILKLAEVIEETEANEEDEREADIAIVAKGAQTTIQHKDPNIAATFEQLLKYYSQIADKAVATRRKNAEAKAPRETTEPTGK